MLASLGLRWWQHIIVRRLHKQCIPAEVTCSRHSIQLRPADPTVRFKLCRRRFLIKITFATTVSKAQGQTVKRDAVYPTSPVFHHGQLCMSFPRSSSFYSITVATIEGIRQRIGNDTYIASSVVYSIKRCIYRSAFKFQIFK
jgi:hypothetical protein